ncbi:MAG TPA: hypothetical protein VKA54_18090 [Gemmatimonadaceae bacterium]|nr:hypothetical protein [Gemmatimonadaceae bacterium]
MSRLRGGQRDNVARFDAIAAQPEAAIVPRLASFLVEGGELARAAAQAVAKCVAVATSDELLELDEYCRQAWWGEYPYGNDARWQSLSPRDVAGLVAPGSEAARVVGVVSFHPNGRVREAAVARLAKMSGGAELPFLLIRLNDWVDPIARRAEQALRQRLTASYADAFVDNLAILLRLGAKRRRIHQALIDGALSLLFEPGSRSALERGLTNSSRAVRRLLHLEMLTRPSPDSFEIVERALSDDDTVIRMRATRVARRELGADSLHHLLPRMLRDPFPAVRAEAIAGAAELGLPDVDERLFEALLDRSRMVRDTARFYLRRHRSFDAFSAFYRERLVSSTSSPTRQRILTSAIAGLGESGQPQDVAVLIPFLGDVRPAVRVASARAIAGLDMDTSLLRLLEMLGDPSPTVTRRVREILTLRAGSVSSDTLRRLMREIPFAHGRLDALRLGAQLGKWDALLLVLESVRDPDVEIRSTAQLAVRRWIEQQNTSFEQPVRRHLLGLRSSLAANRWSLDPATTNELEAIVRYWNPSSPTERTTTNDS